MDINEVFVNAVADGIRKGIVERFGGSYNNPFDKFITECVERHSVKFRKLVDDAITTCTDDSEFQETMKSEVRRKLASTLIQRFGGELEKQVNALKSDPLTRARIVMALEEIVKLHTK